MVHQLGCKWVPIGVFGFVILVHSFSQINYVACHSSSSYQVLGRPNDPKKVELASLYSSQQVGGDHAFYFFHSDSCSYVVTNSLISQPCSTRFQNGAYLGLILGYCLLFDMFIVFRLCC